MRLGAESPCKKWLSRNASSPHRVAGVTRDKFLRVPLFLQATMGREEFRRESEGNFSGGESVLCACCRQCKVNISEVWSGISNEAAAVIAFPITRRASFQNGSGEKTTPGQWLIFMTRAACATYRKQIVQFPSPYIRMWHHFCRCERFWNLFSGLIKMLPRPHTKTNLGMRKDKEFSWAKKPRQFFIITFCGPGRPKSHLLTRNACQKRSNTHPCS